MINKILNNRFLLFIVVTTIMLIPAYFLFFDEVKDNIDRRSIYYMLGEEYSDSDFLSKVKRISNRNINMHEEASGDLASLSVCQNNKEILQLIKQKGGTYNLSHLFYAYDCQAINTIEFLEDNSFSVFDEELDIPKSFLELIIKDRRSVGDYTKTLKLIFEKNPKLKTNKELITIVESMDTSSKEYALKNELLSLFSLTSTNNVIKKP